MSYFDKIVNVFLNLYDKLELRFKVYKVSTTRLLH